MSSPQLGKRKRFQDMKENVVDEIYNLVIASSDFVTEIEAANEEFITMFKNMEIRQSNLISQSVGINERYGSIVDLVAERKKPIIGGTSTTFQSLPVSYSISTIRFLDDSESSLEKHISKTKKAVDKMINMFDETVKRWGEKSDNLKEQAKIIARNKVLLKMQVNEFRSVLYGYDPDNEESHSEDSN